MSFIQKLDNIEAVVKRVLHRLVFILFALMSCLVFAQVCTRFLTNHSLTWSEELSRFILIWLIYLASVIAYVEKGHIIVDVLVMQLKGAAAKAMQLISCLCVLAFGVFIILGAWEFIPTTAMQKSPANGIVMSHVYIAIPVSMALLVLATVKQIIGLFVPGPQDEMEGKA